MVVYPEAVYGCGRPTQRIDSKRVFYPVTSRVFFFDSEQYSCEQGPHMCENTVHYID